MLAPKQNRPQQTSCGNHRKDGGKTQPFKIASKAARRCCQQRVTCHPRVVTRGTPTHHSSTPCQPLHTLVTEPNKTTPWLRIEASGLAVQPNPLLPASSFAQVAGSTRATQQRPLRDRGRGSHLLPSGTRLLADGIPRALQHVLRDVKACQPPHTSKHLRHVKTRHGFGRVRRACCPNNERGPGPPNSRAKNRSRVRTCTPVPFPQQAPCRGRRDTFFTTSSRSCDPLGAANKHLVGRARKQGTHAEGTVGARHLHTVRVA